ncbi:hypothetical protein B0T26DRAFT_179061 [Lasiosphaeria miniovina]|uniref:Aminoglycoside phosphotransferase domain-containing protein n=1 Tax=Lasiosphaeria miniovina TaxID=1954250 RepID=A0AA40B6J9_9PEZI|nr:uncharacterized protein B0T26DRAFT_179061 [Lasiosphaeria miniovina]KAK0728625.1 hypothetical protein B0T26DRAFT_179061 [Lasiosphaeria miniovina]
MSSRGSCGASCRRQIHLAPAAHQQSELTRFGRFRQNIHLVRHPLLDGPVVAKFAELLWQKPHFEAETAIPPVNPTPADRARLRHLTEDGHALRIFLAADAREQQRARTLTACRRLLNRLHALGIKHENRNKLNFLFRSNSL